MVWFLNATSHVKKQRRFWQLLNLCRYLGICKRKLTSLLAERSYQISLRGRKACRWPLPVSLPNTQKTTATAPQWTNHKSTSLIRASAPTVSTLTAVVMVTEYDCRMWRPAPPFISFSCLLRHRSLGNEGLKGLGMTSEECRCRQCETWLKRKHEIFRWESPKALRDTLTSQPVQSAVPKKLPKDFFVIQVVKS